MTAQLKESFAALYQSQESLRIAIEVKGHGAMMTYWLLGKR
ncbi:hypothetical protein [Pseudanabaena sp. ABRG5-3]|nr:hypothetical protein [Pseudanabaena sp. ABRG5-3]